MKTLVIKKGDTGEAITAVLKRKGKAEKLTNKTVKFCMSNGLEAYAQVIDAENGIVMYPIEDTFFNELGFFSGEFKVTYEDGRVLSFPDGDFIPIRIIEGADGNG
ncbi:BppU family phage baseplate upper protein [Halobacillus salinus]|uniref:BppU family phage baseplate upper protein n=1 Tax=Halobacillus salinus TaxID=192814 RepID=UPI0009A8FBB1|nr:BppU family phage baseplate upper protein [Halobacillus salinus]